MSSGELSWAQIQNPNSTSDNSSFSECKLESLLDTRSLEQTWSFLDLPASTTAVDEDPNQSKTAVQMQQAQCKHLYRELTLQKQVGEGAVFQVGLYLHRDGREFAVKHARLGAKRRDGGNNPAGGIFSAMREIQVNFHDTLKRHQNIVDIMGWDWSEKRVPVIITEYAGNGTMRDFLQAPSSFPKRFDLKRNLALDVASGLCALHASDIAHGDVKLENTLVFPHPERGWCAKVSDFSHAVFGVSSKRKSTYPGSGLYNAPEIRRRDSVITSDLLPSCEAFSYGLLVWELLKDGQCFFETGWIYNSNMSNPSSSSVDVMSRIACLERLPPNTLLDRALSFLSGCSSLTRYGKSMFALIFEHTLKDRGTRRSDMSIIASMLDQEDRAAIYYHSTANSVKAVAIWNFSPWCRTVPWMTQTQTVQEFERLVDDFVQPSHAEWYLLLSRCYAEGFGVKIDYSQMIYNLRKAAEHESVEARFMLLLMEEHFPDLIPPSTKQTAARASITVDGTTIFEEPVVRAMQEIKKGSTFAPLELRYITMVQLWNHQNSSQVFLRPFNLMGHTYFWNNPTDVSRFLEDVNASQFSLWWILISYESLASTFQTEGFFEACASIGASSWWTNAMEYARNIQQISLEEREAVIHNSLMAAIQNGQTTIIDTIIAQLDPEDLTGFASRVSRAYTKTPLHFLAFIRRGDTGPLTLKLSSLGFNVVVDQAVSTRSWLQPLGIELHGTPLHTAVRLRSLPAVEALMKMGANPTEISKVDSRSPLELAICLNLFEIVRFMIKSHHIREDKLPGYVTALGGTSSKGTFDTLLLHPALHRWPYAAEAGLKITLKEIQMLGTVSVDIAGEALLQTLRSGWKTATKFEISWNHLVIDSGSSMYPNAWVRDALDLIEEIIGDDPENRDLLRFLFSQTMSKINWTAFLREHKHKSEIEPEPVTLVFNWAERGLAYNLSDLRAKISSNVWLQMVEQRTTAGCLPIDAAISSGCLRTFGIFAQYYPPEECLKRAIDSCAKDVVTHIVRSKKGTIFCDIVMAHHSRTALYHAAATSNTTMIQHLLSLTIPWTTDHVQHLIARTNSAMSSYTLELRIFKWDPVFNMRDFNGLNKTALEIASDRDDIQSIEALLGHDPDENKPADTTQTMLSVAVKSGQVNIAKSLLLRGQSPYCYLPSSPHNSVEVAEVPKWSLIFQATFHAVRGEIRLEVLEKFLALCKDKDVRKINNLDAEEFWKTDRLWNSWLPIHYAIYCGRIGVIRAFLAAEIWSPNEESSCRFSDTSDLNTEMLRWHPAFQYDSLFAKIKFRSILNDPVQEMSKGFRKMKMFTSTAKNITHHSGSNHQSRETLLEPQTDPGAQTDNVHRHRSEYRHCNLWTNPSDTRTLLTDRDVHDLTWGNKSSYTMAHDLVAWTDFVQVPTNGSLMASLSSKSREAIVTELLKWKNRKMKRILDIEVEAIDIDKGMRRLLSEVGDVTRRGRALDRDELSDVALTAEVPSQLQVNSKPLTEEGGSSE